ncbi:MAG TPA: sigma factor, partial [Candidatus Binatia bacterium]|nr:sigma factor [Candidatus Binatia bacterium]
MTWEFTSSREQETPLTPEQRKIVEDHLGLAGYVMNRLYRRSGQEDLYEDLLQICKYGLVKAAKDWDAQSGGSFPAFAITIMKAQYYRYFSYKGMKKRSAEVLSYDQPVEGEEGDSATHLDAFSDSFCLVDHVED